MIHVHFYYEIAKQSQNVLLVLEGMNRDLTMASYPKTNKHYYFFDLLLDDSSGYPITLNYQYRLQNGTILDNKTATLKYKSVVNYIVIKDLTLNPILDPIIPSSPIAKNSSSQTSSMVEAFFFLEIPPPLSNNVTSVLIQSPFTQLIDQTSNNMMYLKEHNLWVTKIYIDSSFPMPFMYYYSVKTSQNIFYGENRLRLIEFNSPTNRSHSVSVYDYFLTKSEPGNITFSYRPIEVSNFPTDKNQLFETDSTRFEIVFLPEEASKNKISEIGVVMSDDEVISAKLSRLSKYAYWLGCLEMPSNFPMSTYSLKIAFNQTAGIEAKPIILKSPINLLMTFKSASFSNIRTNIVKSEVKLNKFVVYFQLVSLKTANSILNKCGTFNTIGEFSNFLKKTDISVVHLHIEKIPGSELFLDPVQLDFSENCVMNFLRTLIENQEVMKVDSMLLSEIEMIVNQPERSNLSLSTLREIKLLLVRYDYRIRKNFESFERFKTVFSDYLRLQLPQTDFEYYVQFVCYCQLFNNIQKAHLNGIQIVTDFSVMDGVMSAIDSLPVISLYSSAIYLSDISEIEERGFSIAQIKDKFHDDSTFVASTFCEKRGSFYCIKPEFKVPKSSSQQPPQTNPDVTDDLISFDNETASTSANCGGSLGLSTIDQNKLMSSLLFIDSSLRSSYFKSLVELNEIEEAKSLNKSDKSDQNEMFDRLVNASKYISASLIVDEKMSIEKGPLNLEKLFLIPSFSASSQKVESFKRSYLVPKGLSHLRTSSFLANADKNKVKSELKSAFKKSSNFMAVYLNDLLFCCDLASLNGHSVITGNDPDRRDVLHVSVKDLVDQMESATKKINDFIRSLYN